MPPLPSATATLADLAVTYPAASRIFHRHGLDFCCHGNRPLAEACAPQGLAPDALLAEIASEQSLTAGMPRWDQRPVEDLVDFLVTFYHRRLREELPELIALAAKVERRHGEKPSCPRGLRALLEQFSDSVLEHLAKEEQLLFPAIVAGRGRMAAGPIHVMEDEHVDHGQSLTVMRGLTSDFTPPPAACPTWRALYLRLGDFEAELMEHIHLENNLLFRRALAE